MLAHDELAFARRGHGRINGAEIRGRHLVGGTGIENDLLVDSHEGLPERPPYGAAPAPAEGA